MSTTVLILSSATGGGHEARAKAFQQWLQTLYGETVNTCIAHPMEEGDGYIGQLGVGFYNLIQRRMPWFHHIYYHIIEAVGYGNSISVRLSRRYRHLLETLRPDIIISVHDCLNRGYFQIAKKFLPNVRCITYCEEHAGGYGFSRHWLCRYADVIFTRTRQAADWVMHKGMPAERVYLSGHLFPPAFQHSLPEPEAMRHALGLEKQRFTILLATGGAGANNHRQLLKALEPLGSRIQVIALCGNNHKVRNALQRHYHTAGTLPVALLGHSTQMHQLIHASSVIVARAGSITAEATRLRCPMILNGMGGWMPQELPTVRYYQQFGAAALMQRTSQLPQLVRQWLDQPQLWQQQKQALAYADPGGNPKTIIQALFDHNRYNGSAC